MVSISDKPDLSADDADQSLLWRSLSRPTSAAHSTSSLRRPAWPASCRQSAAASPSGRWRPSSAFFVVFEACSRPMLRRSALDDVAGRGLLLGRDRLAATLLVDEVDQRRFILVLELVGLEPAGLPVRDVLDEISMETTSRTLFPDFGYRPVSPSCVNPWDNPAPV
jgi:hypothetical protein